MSEPAKVEIKLPQDQYLHSGAAAEWWWHSGTLVSETGHRLFGFEINATGFIRGGFSQIEITDVENQRHYQKATQVVPLPEKWAEKNPKKPWYVRIDAAENDGAIVMQAIDGNPLAMQVEASFLDTATSLPCKLTLTLCQAGEPLLVWGTGCTETNPQGKTPLERNNYHYALTRLNASGTIEIGNEVIPVTGLTWMDHEYGFYGNPVTNAPLVWTLQDIQMSNGLHLSNYTKPGVLPVANVPMASNATLLTPDGQSVFVETVTTPHGPIYTNPKGIEYFLSFTIQVINHPDFNYLFQVNSLMPNQGINHSLGLANVYEGVAACTAFLEGSDQAISGTAWIEQQLSLSQPQLAAGLDASTDIDFVSKLAANPEQVPEMLFFIGYLGKSPFNGYSRLYLNVLLSDYLDIPSNAILHTQRLPAAYSPLGAMALWVKKDAALIAKGQTPMAAQVQFFSGELQQVYMGAQAPQVCCTPGKAC